MPVIPLRSGSRLGRVFPFDVYRRWNKPAGCGGIPIRRRVVGGHIAERAKAETPGRPAAIIWMNMMVMMFSMVSVPSLMAVPIPILIRLPIAVLVLIVVLIVVVARVISSAVIESSIIEPAIVSAILG